MPSPPFHHTAPIYIRCDGETSRRQEAARKCETARARATLSRQSTYPGTVAGEGCAEEAFEVVVVVVDASARAVRRSA